MGFKEQLMEDIDNIFLNLEELAEIHSIEGRKVPVLVDNDRLDKLKKGQVFGLVEADMLVMGKETDFPAELEPGSLLNVDGREMLVAESGRDMGIIEIALCQNRRR